MKFTSYAQSLLITPALVLAALEANLDDDESIKKAAKLVAQDLMEYYHGDEPGHTVGILPGPPPDGDYYWWQGGALWGTMLDYWHWTGDDTWNDDVYESILHQAATTRDFMHDNWTASLGNDDQAFWGMSAMLAAELNFRDPPKDEAQWLALAQAVWNEQAADDRRDDECGGGLRWQIYSINTGYNYKNTISNGCFFNIGARLARYTNNETYAKWSVDTWDWLTKTGLIDKDWNVHDGAHVEDQCKKINTQQYSYNAAVLLQGAAYMYNYTEDDLWKDRLNNLADRTLEFFFPEDVAFEPQCEQTACNFDKITFKGFTHRWLAASTQMAPFLREKVMPVLKKSAQAAVDQCTGGDNGRMCGFHWSSGTYDGQAAAGNQMSALAALSSLLVHDARGPVTNSTGGTSAGDENAGAGRTLELREYSPITTADKAGAGIITALIIIGHSAAIWWMVWE